MENEKYERVFFDSHSRTMVTLYSYMYGFSGVRRVNQLLGPEGRGLGGVGASGLTSLPNCINFLVISVAKRESD